MKKVILLVFCLILVVPFACPAEGQDEYDFAGYMMVKSDEYSKQGLFGETKYRYELYKELVDRTVCSYAATEPIEKRGDQTYDIPLNTPLKNIHIEDVIGVDSTLGSKSNAELYGLHTEIFTENISGGTVFHLDSEDKDGFYLFGCLTRYNEYRVKTYELLNNGKEKLINTESFYAHSGFSIAASWYNESMQPSGWVVNY